MDKNINNNNSFDNNSNNNNSVTNYTNGNANIIVNSSAVDVIDSLVLDWLIRSGYHSTFTKLPAATAAASSAITGSLALRAEICRLIRAGGANIKNAVNLIESSFPIHSKSSDQVLRSTRSIPSGPLNLRQTLFLLKIQLFIELMRQKSIPAALVYVQTTLMAASSDNDEEALQEALGVLAYSDSLNSPLAWIFDQTHRYADLANLVNSSLFAASRESSSGWEAPLIGLLRQVLAVDEVIGEVSGFGNDLDDRKWTTINQFIQTNNNNNNSKEYVKTIKND